MIVDAIWIAMLTLVAAVGGYMHHIVGLMVIALMVLISLILFGISGGAAIMPFILIGFSILGFLLGRYMRSMQKKGSSN